MDPSGTAPCSNQTQRLGQWLAWFASQMLRSVPLPVTYWFADRCGDLDYLLFAHLRRNVAGNVAQVLGAAVSARQVRRVVRQVFRTSARNVFDL